MERDRKIYETYVVNLDNSRLFWLSVILLLFLCLAFLAGLYMGRKFISGAPAKPGTFQPVREGQSVSFENVLLPVTTESTQYSNLEFYKVLPKEKLTSEDIEHSIPYKKKQQDLKPARELQKPAIVETKFPSIDRARPESGSAGHPLHRAVGKYQRVGQIQAGTPDESTHTGIKAGSGRKDSISGQTRVERIEGPGPDKMRPYAIQVASYQNGSTAEAIKHQLESDQFSAYVIRVKINNRLYFRVRLGPYASQAKAESVLSELRLQSGFSGAYVCTD